jgi:putative flippase GtrA
MKKTIQQACYFVISGCIATAIDSLVYCALSAIIPISIAKGMGFLVGTTVAYFNNKYITFKKKERSFKETRAFIGLYAGSLVLNVAVNHIVLDKTQMVTVAFVSAALVSMVVNFIGQKFWVFSPRYAR